MAKKPYLCLLIIFNDHTDMKRFLSLMAMTIACAILAVGTARADNDTPITAAELPATAQEMIKEHFAGGTIMAATREKGAISSRYEVTLQGGTEIEFDRRGRWTEVDCKSQAVPSGIVPGKISDYVRQQHAGQKITQIERSGGTYEIELSNGTEIEFNRHYKAVRTER